MTAHALRDLDVALVGVGFHGRRIGELISAHGARIVAAADSGAPAGSAIDEVVGSSSGDVVVHADVREALDAAVRLPDVAVIAMSGSTDEHDSTVVTCLERGINVVTLSTDAFDPGDEWRARMDDAARAAGASLLATGVQDVWWVQLPALVAGVVANLQCVDLEHIVGLGELSPSIGEVFGLGAPVSAFPAVERALAGEAPVMGGALRVLGRRLGLHPGELERHFEPVVAESVLPDGHGGEIAEGTLAGATEIVRFDAAGVEFTGRFTSRLLGPADLPADVLVLRGDPGLRLEQSPFPGPRLTDTAVAARLIDVVNAAPGFVDIACLPAPQPMAAATDSGART